MNFSRITHVLLVLLPCFLNAQTKNSSILQYNKLVNEAELKICDSNFSEANNLYTIAFRLNPNKPFSRDLFTAFHCAMDVSNYNAAENYLKILLDRGLNSKFIDGMILDFYTGENRDTITSMIKKYKNNIDKRDALNSTILNMYNKDQKVRAYFAHIETNGDYMTDSVYKVDSENSYQLFQIIQQLGHLPNENEIRNIEDFALAGSYMDIIIKHNILNYSQNKQISFFDTVLYNSIFSFDYPANTFASLLSRCYLNNESYIFSHGGTTIKFPISIVICNNIDDNGKPYFKRMPMEEETRINKERGQLGLSTIQELRRKTYFSYLQRLNNGKYFAVKDGAIVYIDMNSQEIQNELQNNEIYEYKP